jgi:hypothetical protein
MLIAAGIGWYLVQNRAVRASRLMRGARQFVSRIESSVGNAFSSAAERSVGSVQGAAGTIGKSLRSATDSVRASLATFGAQAQGGASAVGEAVRYGAGSGRRTAARGVNGTSDVVSTMWRDHPLAVAATVLAAGATAGMLVPATEREQRVMGDAVGKAKKTVRRGGKRLLREGKQFVRESASVAVKEARRQGLDPSEIGRRVKRVVSKTKDAVTTGA